MSRELKLALPEGRYKHGKYLHTVQIDTETYLAYLRGQLEQMGQVEEEQEEQEWERRGGRSTTCSAGGVVEQRKIENLDDLADECDMVVNCSGLGAR